MSAFLFVLGSVAELVYCNSLENCRVRNGSVSSNLTTSAKKMVCGQDGNAADC